MGQSTLVGVGYWGSESNYMRPRPHSELHREAIRHAQLAEALGFDCFWVPEHHFVHDGYLPSSMIGASALLAATDTITIGTLSLLPLQGAHGLAHSVAAAQSIGPDRLWLGIGAGYRRVEFWPSGLDLDVRGPLMEQGLGELIDGKYAPLVSGTPIFVGSNVGVSIRRAARFGASMTLAYGGPAEVAERRALWEKHLRPEPAQMPRVSLVCNVWVDHDTERLERIRRRMREAWRFYARIEEENALAADPHAEIPDIEDVVDALSATDMVGSPEYVTERLSAIADAGADDLALRIHFAGIDDVSIERCMGLLSAEVLPELRKG